MKDTYRSYKNSKWFVAWYVFVGMLKVLSGIGVMLAIGYLAMLIAKNLDFISTTCR